MKVEKAVGRIAQDQESGFALLLTMFAVILFAGIAVLCLCLSSNYSRLTSHDAEQAEALRLAESGISLAKLELYRIQMQNPTGGWDSTLVGADGAGGTADDGVLNPGPALPLGGGTLTVRVVDNDDEVSHAYGSADGDGAGYYWSGTASDPFTDRDKILVIRSTGLCGRSRRTVEALVKMGGQPFSAPGVILTGGDLEIAGDAAMGGYLGSIHVNGNLLISGNPTIEKNAKASGSLTITGTPLIGGCWGGGYPEKTIPSWNLADYRPLTDYEFRSDGTIRDNAGSLVFDQAVNTASKWNGWYFSLGQWILSGSAPPDGTFYFATGVKIDSDAKDAGGGTGIWTVTLITEGSLHIKKTANMRARLDNLFCAVNGDLLIEPDPVIGGVAGDPTATPCFLLVKEQFRMRGNKNHINGCLICANEDDVFTLVQGMSVIEQNSTFLLESAISLNERYTTQLSVLSWTETLQHIGE
jgi:hypothetical protein